MHVSGTHLFTDYIEPLFKSEAIAFNRLQNRVILVACIAFGCIAACYMLYHMCDLKRLKTKSSHQEQDNLSFLKEMDSVEEETIYDPAEERKDPKEEQVPSMSDFSVAPHEYLPEDIHPGYLQNLILGLQRKVLESALKAICQINDALLEERARERDDTDPFSLANDPEIDNYNYLR